MKYAVVILLSLMSVNGFALSKLNSKTNLKQVIEALKYWETQNETGYQFALIVSDTDVDSAINQCQIITAHQVNEEFSAIVDKASAEGVFNATIAQAAKGEFAGIIGQSRYEKCTVTWGENYATVKQTTYENQDSGYTVAITRAYED